MATPTHTPETTFTLAEATFHAWDSCQAAHHIPPKSAYSCPVDRTGDPMEAYAAWVSRVVEHYRDQGWSISELSKRSEVGRTILYRWLSGDPAQPRPTRETVERFCRSLGIPTAEPFAIWGWAAVSAITPVALPPIVDDDVQAVQDIITRHDLTPDEVDDVRAVLRMIVGRFGATDGGQREAG